MIFFSLLCGILLFLITTAHGRYDDERVLLLFKALECHDYEIARVIIHDWPGITNTYDQYGCTALCRAAAIGDIKAVNVLLSDPNINVNAWCSNKCVGVSNELNCDRDLRRIEWSTATNYIIGRAVSKFDCSQALRDLGSYKKLPEDLTCANLCGENDSYCEHFFKDGHFNCLPYIDPCFVDTSPQFLARQAFCNLFPSVEILDESLFQPTTVCTNFCIGGGEHDFVRNYDGNQIYCRRCGLVKRVKEEYHPPEREYLVNDRCPEPCPCMYGWNAHDYQLHCEKETCFLWCERCGRVIPIVKYIPVTTLFH